MLPADTKSFSPIPQARIICSRGILKAAKRTASIQEQTLKNVGDIDTKINDFGLSTIGSIQD